MSQTPQRSPSAFRRWLGRIVLMGLALYLAAAVTVGLLQRRMIYHPPVFTSERVDELARSARLERWKNSAGESIGMKRLSPRQPAEGRVLILYGTGSCATKCAHYADVIQSVAAFDVFIVEYPGYADRPGSPSQAGLFHAADEALQLLATNEPIYLVGESLGTGVASYLAGTHPDRVTGVVLLAPYNRLTGVAQHRMPIFPARLMLLDRFSSEDYLRDYHGPVAVLLADRDQTVPEQFGRRLYDDYAGPKQLWEFPQGTHRTVMNQPLETWKRIIGFWRASRSL